MTLHIHRYRYHRPLVAFLSEDGLPCWTYVERCRCGKERNGWQGVRGY